MPWKTKPGSEPLHKGEVLPVPVDMVPRVWKRVRYILKKIPNYDLERTHSRLVVGIDWLWVAVRKDEIRGIVITSVSPRPPSKRPCFQRKDPALMRSLTIHIAGTDPAYLLSWLPSAIKRISAYAREEGCRQLFLIARKSWQRHIKRFYSSEWEGVAVSRDRPTKSTCKRFRNRNTPGYFRPMVPVAADKFTRHMHGFLSTCYFKEAA